MLEINLNGEWRPWTGQRDADGVAYPGNIEELWRDAELAAKGFRRMPPPPPRAITATDTKNEAQRRIQARHPDRKQANATARSVELVNSRIGRAWTTAEQAEYDAAKVMWAWIRATEAASDALEALSPIPLDYADNKHWPA